MSNYEEIIAQYFCHLCVFNLNNELLIQRRRDLVNQECQRWELTIIVSTETEENRISRIQENACQRLGIEQLSGIKFDRQIRESAIIRNYYAVKQDVGLNDLGLSRSKWTELRFVNYEEALRMMREHKFAVQDEWLLKHLFDFGYSL